MLAAALTLDVLWFNRNRVAHGQAPTEPEFLIQEVHRRYHSHKLAWSCMNEGLRKHWEPPEPGQINVNYDVAVQAGRLIFAAITRDSQGQILHARSGTIEGLNPIKGEARAARLACEMAIELPGVKVIIEGDCLNLVTQVHERAQPVDWEIAGEVETIRRLLELHQEWTLAWTPREGNEALHLLAKWCARQLVAGVIRLENLPSDVICDVHDAGYGVSR